MSRRSKDHIGHYSQGESQLDQTYSEQTVFAARCQQIKNRGPEGDVKKKNAAN